MVASQTLLAHIAATFALNRHAAAPAPTIACHAFLSPLPVTQDEDAAKIVAGWKTGDEARARSDEDGWLANRVDGAGETRDERLHRRALEEHVISWHEHQWEGSKTVGCSGVAGGALVCVCVCV